VREFIGEAAGGHVLDLYSGVGVFALCLAAQVGQITAVEEHPRGPAAAHRSAEKNGFDNISFYKGKVEQCLREMQGSELRAAVLDPPPEGCGRFVVNALAKQARPERLVYVAQNPLSFAEDAAILEDRGFRLTRVQPIDVTPHTANVELVALFDSSLQGGKRRSSIAQARRLLDRVRKSEET